ncbi:MAG: ATP-dependent DNA helicase RecG [Fibrobacterota bacterium]
MTEADKHRLDFLSPLTGIPGLGPKRAQALAASGLHRIQDLLYWFPYRFVFKGAATPISQLKPGTFALVQGVITDVRVERRRKTLLRARLQDAEGTAMELIWFSGIPYFRKVIRSGKQAVFWGTVQRFIRPQMVHPEFDFSGKAITPERPWEPRYPMTEHMKRAKIGQKDLQKFMLWIFKNLQHYRCSLPEVLVEKYRLPPLKKSLFFSHFPRDLRERTEKWFFRIRFEELYGIALSLRWNRRQYDLPGFAFSEGKALQDDFIAQLPFELTADQVNAVTTLGEISGSSRRMHSLLQGDVGCGKTITAFLATLRPLASGYQVAWIAPTTVLADQSSRTITAWLKDLGYTCALLTSRTKKSEKREILRGIKLGTIQYLVGTHALIQEDVTFASLGMAVIDEQHRFGAQQRQILQEKSPAADTLMMSATPIPQSMAATVYSDLELLSIKTLPARRKPIKTRRVPTQKETDMMQFMRRRIRENGEKAFWVTPRIELDEEAEKMMSIEEREKILKKTIPDVNIHTLHGRMKPAEKEAVMQDFSADPHGLMLATTVIEVGVDIPAATMMIIENSENFGLSQLHQLRGRVGRSDLQAWCFILSEHSAESVQERLRAFCSTTDGFKIAEMDLTMRGTGEVAGMRQSGFSDLRWSNILEVADLFQSINDDVGRLIDPDQPL